MTAPEKFDIHLPDSVLDDLRDRLNATRWFDDPTGGDEYYGVSSTYLKELVRYWATDFDWRAAERKLNSFANYRVTIDDVPIHFVREPGVGPAPIPLILNSGWPWMHQDWNKVIRPLADPGAHGGDPADAFDVIVTSLPGFGFSTPLPRGDMNFWKIAELWHVLATKVLGFEKYAVGGSDYGSLVTSQLGHKYADELYGIWLGHTIPLTIFQGDRGWDLTGGKAIPPEAPDEIRSAVLSYQRRFVPHVVQHVLEPHTLGYGLNDSPAGMLAWILTRWTKWSDNGGNVENVFPRDHMLTSATIYWATQSITSSIRSYANAARYPWRPSHDRSPIVEAPAGITFLGYENPPGISTAERVAAWQNSPLAKNYNPVHLKAHEHGGHFTPFENPDAVISDIRETFRTLRR